MSRTSKDGRRGGGHSWKRRFDVEWGSRRGPLGWKTPSPFVKFLTHRMERRANKRLVRAELLEEPR